jgi:hypothetical protein
MRALVVTLAVLAIEAGLVAAADARSAPAPNAASAAVVVPKVVGMRMDRATRMLR